MKTEDNRQRVALVDDDASVRDALREGLELVGGFHLVADCASGDAVLERWANLPPWQRPEIVLLEISFKHGDGFHYCRELRRLLPGLVIALHTTHCLPCFVNGARHADADAYLGLTRFNGHLGGGALRNDAHMSKRNKTEPAERSETTVVPPSPQTKRYDDAFKRAAGENWIKTGKPGTQIAAELGISSPSLKDWQRRYYGDATPQRDDLAAENRALKTELTRAREQRDILKKTLGIFTEPSRNATKPLNA